MQCPSHPIQNPYEFSHLIVSGAQRNDDCARALETCVFVPNACGELANSSGF